jgi:hypothetical protein
MWARRRRPPRPEVGRAPPGAMMNAMASPAPAPAPPRAGHARARVLPLIGVAWAALAALDPLLVPAWPGLLLAIVSWAWARHARRGEGLAAGCALLALVYAAQAGGTPNLGADSRGYFVFLPSVLRHHGLDFEEALEALGMGGLAADSAVRRGMHPAGPALLWSPFYVATHAYVVAGRALGRRAYEADGLAAPYLRAPALGTGLIAVAGVIALVAALRTRHDRGVARVAVAAVVLGTSLPYYVVVQPVMAHGVVFGVAALLVWAWVMAEREPTRRRWVVLGALLGLLVLVRWQAVVAVVLPAGLALRDLRRRRVAAADVGLAALAAAAVFAPQLAVWKAQYGRWITMPQGPGYVDWSSPHLLDVLVSADRGLFSWTPVAALGVLGLAVGWRRWGLLAGSGLVVFALTAWVNGGVSDWAGSDAFGARRFDLVLPLLAVGMAVIVEGVAAIVAHRPLLAPVAMVALLAAWNLGLMRLYVRGTFPEAAPLESVAAGEARLLRRAAERTLGALFGARGRDLAYRFFVGEYFYVNANLGGTIAVGGDDARYLGEGWSPPRWHEGGPRFRWALYPRACLRIPLAGPVTLPAVLSARVPRRLETQGFTVIVNGTSVGAGRLGPEWSDAPFRLPATALVRGENEVCFQFERGWGEEGQQVGAQVSRVQLP